MHNRITRLAAAAVLLLAILLLARHLTGRESTVAPAGRDHTVAQEPHSPDAPAFPETVREQEHERLAQEIAAAQQLFAQTDVKGLLYLLDTGLEPTRIAIAGYLAQIGDESVLPALQRLADQWQGPAHDNPFQRSVEQIRNIAPEEGRTAPDDLSTEESKPPVGTATVSDGPHIVVRVTEKATGRPIPRATIQVRMGNESGTHAADDLGVFVLDLGESIPDYVRIATPHEGYVCRGVTLRGLSRERLPTTVEFALEKGIVIGGIVQDEEGRPVEGARVESYIGEEQQFDRPCVSVRIELTTDAEGRWRAGGVPREINRLWFNVYHPQFADDGFEMPGDLKLDDLRAERAVMVLAQGIGVTGRVTDLAGKPIAGAELLVGSDYFARDWTQTDDAGHFEFRHLRPLNQSFLLTVQAPGFAPQRRELPSVKDLAPVDLVLEPARLLIGRVVDSAGRPIADAFLSTEEWNGWRTVKWQGRTDANGTFVWDYPPHDAIEIRISKSGYREFEGQVVAKDREQTFVLARPTTIQGSVTDSETGRTVDRFKLTPGARWLGGTRATWQTSEGWVKWFTDGRYSYTFSGDAGAYAVRIEADGYLPAESPFVDANETEVTIDIALTKGQGPSGYVFDANAAPVEGAEVFWHKTILIQNGQIMSRTQPGYAKTDRDGRFAFKPEDREDLFVAICEQGIGVVAHEELVDSGIITLTPWARVQGRLRVGTRPGANRRLQLVSQGQFLGSIAHCTNETSTDEQGRFVFERVHPGEFGLYNQMHEVLPGQTLELHLGGTGRTVKGELALSIPADVPIWPDLYLTTIGEPVPFEKYPKPPGYERMSPDGIEAWMERYGQTAEGRAYADWLGQMYHQPARNLRVEMDGRSAFHVDNVEPGVYALKGVIRFLPVHDRSRISEIVGRLWHEVVVPPFAGDAEMDVPLDLGTLAVLPDDLMVGDAAPAFDAPSFGLGRIRLEDYRDRVLLVAFAAWGYTNPVSPGVYDLKDFYQRFGENPRYAQVSLLFSGNPLMDKRIIDEAGLDWPHGMLNAASREETEYRITTRHPMPWTVLISSRGEILATGLHGEDLQRAVEEALKTAP
ncbi:carboxypeptidase regulatory-like domain-containing protein [Anaerobaca lacustris]|uniref:Carboxypeptidase regulatory-like domain-containing protein n=1 Tax=Anaerobaca lacustris TaxID=3044600 RepID=A0AAW6TSA6_9BACT|nr:carboxypeptidase regulatory-like domain-containing protein [Sedimentisphaerales bacterium M17dextr]